MADPILAGAIRVQAIFQGGSQLPEDRYVNTFAFASDVANTDAGLDAAIDKVEQFYVGTFAGGNVMTFMSSHPIHQQTSMLRAYSLEDPPPRVPRERLFGSEFTPGTSTALPSEVCACLSYYAVQNTPRRRGRIYIGPLGTNALASPSETPGRLHADAQAVILAAGAAMAADDVDSPRWSILTLPDTGSTKLLRPITDLWVDNAFDTQRRRGEVATTRLTAVANP